MIPKGVKFLNNWISIGRAIEFLTNEETNSVTFYNANPDFNGPNYKISCSGEWTGWQDIDFLGESLIECLDEAVEKKQSIPVIWKAEK